MTSRDLAHSARHAAMARRATGASDRRCCCWLGRIAAEARAHGPLSWLRGRAGRRTCLLVPSTTSAGSGVLAPARPGDVNVWYSRILYGYSDLPAAALKHTRK